MADSWTKRFADVVTSVWPFGPTPDKVLPVKPRQLREGIAFIDPSRLFGGKLSAPYNPSVLVTRKGLNVFDQMKMDEQVKSALLFKKHAALAAGWEVVSPGDEDDDWEVTEFVRDAFEMLPGGMVRALRGVLLGIDYGYSVSEKIFGDGWGALDGKIVLNRLVSVKPHYIDFVADANGVILELQQNYVPGQRVSVPLPKDKFVIYTHDCEFENPYGRSDLEAAYRAWWTKNNSYKWLAVMLERYGMPPLFLMYDQNVYQGSQVEQLKSVVKNIQNATMGVLPRNNKDDLEFSTQQLAAQAKDVFLGALSRFDADIAKALLQPSLTGFSGEGGSAENRGSLARSNVHWKAFLYVVEELQGSVATAVNEQVVRQLCDLNFPNLKSYPQFRFARLDDEAQLELFQTWLKLTAGNVVNKIPDDEIHIRKALGFPDNENPEVLPSVTQGGGGRDKIPGIPDNQIFALPEEEWSTEMREFADNSGGTWMRVGEQTLCVEKVQCY